MASADSSNLGVPIKLLYQGEGHIVTVELKTGEVYRGQLAQAEETMNCQLKEGEDRWTDRHILIKR
jgi:small nuclear ribonucleoprotein D3